MKKTIKPAWPNVVAGKLGAVFLQSTSSAVDMKANQKGNAPESVKRRVSMVRPSAGGDWGPFVQRQAAPPASANWRATIRAMPGRPVGK